MSKGPSVAQLFKDPAVALVTAVVKVPGPGTSLCHGHAPPTPKVKACEVKLYKPSLDNGNFMNRVQDEAQDSLCHRKCVNFKCPIAFACVIIWST